MAVSTVVSWFVKHIYFALKPDFSLIIIIILWTCYIIHYWRWQGCLHGSCCRGPQVDQMPGQQFCAPPLSSAVHIWVGKSRSDDVKAYAQRYFFCFSPWNNSLPEYHSLYLKVNLKASLLKYLSTMKEVLQGKFLFVVVYRFKRWLCSLVLPKQ